MYCRMCGSKLGDADHFCKSCGMPTGIGEPTSTPADEPVIKEEIVFNPPYDKKTDFQEDGTAEDGYADKDPSEDLAEEEHRNLKREKEDLKGYILEVDIAEASQIQTEEKEPGSEPVRKQTGTDEFTWNVHQFPKAKKNTDDADFNWNMEEFSPSGKKENTTFEEELFQEIREDSTRIKEQNIERFFTFSKKNEEFQKLLDKEYEKFRTRSYPQTEPISEQGESAVTELSSEAHEEAAEVETTDEKTASVQAAEGELTAIQADAEDDEFGQTADDFEQTAFEAAPNIVPATPSVAVPAQTAPLETAKEEIKSHKPEHIAEMAGARALFFGEELIRDNESIIKKLEDTSAGDKEDGKAHKAEETQDSQSAEPETPKGPEAIGPESTEERDLTAHPEDNHAGLTMENAENEEKGHIPRMAPAIPTADEAGEEAKTRRNIWQILLIIIAIILAVEIAILAIRYFDPDSVASKTIGKAQTEISNTVTGWTEGIKDMFSGKASEEENKPENKGQDVGKDNAGQTTPPAVEPPGVTEPPVTTPPDPKPMTDQNALVTSQMGNNKNIEQVKANTTLAYQAGKNYGIADLNQSKPIANNIWKAPESGEPVYYDKSVVGTVIAFDSKWIDYVNSGDKSVLELLKKGGKAYQNAAGFTKTGKIKETFKLLEIGEIRQGANGFYVWTHEELQLTEKGKTTLKKYNWIYYMEPVEEKLQIVNYFKFQ